MPFCYSKSNHSILSFNNPPPSTIYTLSLHDALPIWHWPSAAAGAPASPGSPGSRVPAARRRRCSTASVMRERSEEHTSELQSQFHLVCRLLLEKKKRYQCRIQTRPF